MVAVWVIAPLPRILATAAFMKLGWVFVAPYAVGMGNQAHDRCGGIWLVPTLTLRSAQSGFFANAANSEMSPWLTQAPDSCC